MIAYRRDWLNALHTRDQAREWHHWRLLTDAQWEAVQAAYPANFYAPNVFVRIGLAIFCLILMLAVTGLTAVVWEPDEQAAAATFSLFWGILWGCLLEFWAVRSARHYGSGIDDMLLYGSVTAIITGLGLFLPDATPAWVYCALAFPVLTAGAIHYADRLLAAGAYLAALLSILLLIKEITSIALYLLPLAGLVFSGLAYRFARQGGERYDWRYWQAALAVVETLSLATFYASGNYWAVQQAGSELYGLEQAPLPWLFWTFTFGVPAGYIWLGLRQKDRLLLDVGLACVVAAVFTFRYYFHVLPLTWAAIIAGAVLFVTAYFSIRYLRRHPGAFTYAAGLEKSLLQEVEEQLIEQTIASQSGPTPEKKESFGGGGFGGGGAGENF